MIAIAAAWAGVERGGAPAGLEAAFAPRRVALVVGVDAYDDPALDDLAYAAKDAADLSAVLQNPTIGGYDVVSTVVGTVSSRTFWSAFDAVTAGLQRDDTFVLYVAGHGTLDLGAGDTSLYLLPTDGWLAQPAETGIALRELSAALEALPARRKVLVVDACYAGTGRSRLAPAVRERLQGLRGPIPAPPALQVSKFSAHLYAAAVHQPAIEDPALQNGVYTHFLVEGLRGAADADGDGLVEVMEAHQWARDRTLAHTGGTQVPWAETIAVGRDAVFLAGHPDTRSRAEEALLVGLASLPAGATLTVDGVPRGAGPVVPGRRALEVTADGSLLWADTVVARRGRRIAIDERVAERRSHLELGLGAAAGTESTWLGGLGPELVGRWLPPDPRGARAWVTAATGVANGASGAPGGPFVTGTWSVALGAGPALDRTRIGPELGVGGVWRGAPGGLQHAWALAPAVSATSSGWGIVGGLSLAAPVFVADGAVVASPRVTVMVGLRPGGG